MNAEEIKTAPISDVVTTWGIEIYDDRKNDELKIIVRKAKQLPTGGIEGIKERKQEAIEYLVTETTRINADRKERELHVHSVTIVGSESTTVTVDDRKNIDEQITEIWASTHNWCGVTRDQIADQIYRQLGKIKEKHETEEKKEREFEELRGKFEVVKISTVQQAKGGEDGTDGFADLTIRQKSNGEELRVITKNIFDFGYYGNPHVRGGTDAALNRKDWTTLEKEGVSWAEKFGPLNKNLRMS